MSNCPLCHRTAVDGEYLCQLHAGELHDRLAELPAQARLLEQFVIPAGAPAQGRLGGTGRATAPVPVDLRVLVLLGPGHYDPATPDDDGQAPILATLGAWAGHIAYTYPATYRDPYGTVRTEPCDEAWPAHGNTITSWCAWLTAYLPYALTLPSAPELHRAVDNLVHRIRDITHTVPHRHPMAAPCPSCDAFALVRTDGQWRITCTACGHRLDPQTYDEHAAAVLEREQAG